MCELDTVHIHVKEVSNHVKELPYATCTYCIVLCKLAWVYLSSNQPIFVGLEVVDEQRAWYVEVCV